MRILLAEDDTTLRETLAEAMRKQGYEVVAVANGAAAMEALAEGVPFDGAVLDGLLPKMTGFDVGAQIRATSPRTGIVLMSGVFKSNAQQQDQIQKTGAKSFLAKPFDIPRLLDVLKPFAPPPSPSSGGGGGGSAAAAVSTVEQQPLPAEGNLLETPPLFLGWRIQREHHTGILEFFGSTDRARLFCYKGRAVFAQHSDSMLHVGIELLKEGLLTPEQFKSACDSAVNRATGIYEVLKSEGMATEAQLKLAYKALVPQIIERVSTLTGRFRWTATDAFTSVVPSASATIVDAMLSGIAKATDKDLEPHVAPRRPLRLAPGEAWNEVAALLMPIIGSDSLTRAINGRATIAQLLEVSPTAKERTARLRQTYVLMSTMAVRASLEPIAMTRPAPPPEVVAAPSPPPSSPTSSASSQGGFAASRKIAAAAEAAAVAAAADAAIAFSDADNDARNRIVAKYNEIQGKNHFEVLGVDRKADVAALKKAYFALSRDFHPDSFAGLQIGGAQRQLETVFSAIQEAYAVLTDADKRGEFEAKMRLEEGGGSSDIGAIFAAESDFNRVKNLVERGELVGAAKLIGKVAAVLASSEEARGYKVFLDWWGSKNVNTASEVIKELQTLQKAAPAAYALNEFQGWIHLETNNLKSARAQFKRVLEVDPRNAGADRGMRAVGRKQEEQEKAAAGFGRLFKR